MLKPLRSLSCGICVVVAMAVASVPVVTCRAEILSVASLDLTKIQQGWGTPRANQSVEGNKLSIGGQTFEEGIGTHADSVLLIDLGGKSRRFTAMVGVDDEVRGRMGSVVFRVLGDGKDLYDSGLMKADQPARKVEVNLTGARMLMLMVEGGADGINYDHADWANFRIEYDGFKPQAIDAPKEEAVILTPRPSPKPRINGARVFGVRPGNPFLYTIAATGDRPMTFSADGLPAGLFLDAKTGMINGSLKETGEYLVTLQAKNALGTAERKFKIVCGPQIGLTPAMGWNSWNCFASAVTAEKVKAAVDAMVKSGLINHGWTYINIDDFWEVHRDSRDPTLQGPQRDAQGLVLANPRFRDMKGLVDYVHSQGLKIGLYSSPGPWTCGGCVGSYQHEDQDAKQYGDWGFDYLKYDWCSYGEIERGNTRAGYMKPYQVMRAALDKAPRDIIYSLCQYGMGNVWEWGEQVGGNSWRTTGDITDTWSSMSSIGFSQAGHEKFAGPGHFNDPDMLVVGLVGWGPNLHPTHLTPNEQYTHITLWCLLTSPLLIGCDMTQMDDFTMNLLTNDEVLEVNQDQLGRQAGQIAQDGRIEVWAKDMEDGSKAVGLFNRSEFEAPVKAMWQALGIKGKQQVRDLWRQKDLGEFTNQFEAKVPRHGVVLVRLWPAQ